MKRRKRLFALSLFAVESAVDNIGRYSAQPLSLAFRLESHERMAVNG